MVSRIPIKQGRNKSEMELTETHTFRLISKDRTEDATMSLRRLRRKDASEETIQEEISILRHAQGNEGKGSWVEVFTGTNRVMPLLPPLLQIRN